LNSKQTPTFPSFIDHHPRSFDQQNVARVIVAEHADVVYQGMVHCREGFG